MQLKSSKIFLVFEIIAFKLVAVNRPFFYQNTFGWKSTCLTNSLPKGFQKQAFLSI